MVDEAWAILSNLGVARWLQSSWKLSRAFGVSNVAVLHRVSDLHSVGASDSEQVALAQGLLADSETRVVYAQSPGELSVASDLLSLSTTEAELLPQLRRGVALWKVGQGSFLVQHRLSQMERMLVDTDAAMGGGLAACRPSPPPFSRSHSVAPVCGRLVPGLPSPAMADGRRHGPGRPLGPSPRPARRCCSTDRRPTPAAWPWAPCAARCIRRWSRRNAPSRSSWWDRRRAGRPPRWPCRRSWPGKDRWWRPA